MKEKVYTPPPAPPRAAEAGFNRLVFEDDFNTLDIAYGENTGQKWNAGLHWYPVPDKSCFTIQDSTLIMTASDPVSAERGHVDLCTQWHNCPSSPTKDCGVCFEPYGYFEARCQMYDWAAWWLFDWNRIWIWADKVKPDDPSTWTSEIDITETDSERTYSSWSTLHKNTSSDGLPDEQNWPAENVLNDDVQGYWHD